MDKEGLGDYWLGYVGHEALGQVGLLRLRKWRKRRRELEEKKKGAILVEEGWKAVREMCVKRKMMMEGSSWREDELPTPPSSCHIIICTHSINSSHSSSSRCCLFVCEDNSCLAKD